MHLNSTPGKGALTHRVGPLRQGEMESRIYKSEASLTVWDHEGIPILAACLNLPQTRGKNKSIGWASLRKVGGQKDEVPE